MPRKRTIEELKEQDFLKMSELAEFNDVRYSTVKYYAELGILPFEQQGQRLARYYPRAEASKRLQEILKLRDKGRSVSDIVARYKEQTS